MTIDAGLGANLDIGHASFQALIGLKASVDDLAAAVKRIERIEELYQQIGPVDHQLNGSGTAPASGSLFISLGSPAPGRFWILRRLIVGGVTWVTTAAGAANVYASPSRPDGAGLSMMVDNASSLPNKAFYSSRQVTVHQPSHLWVEVTTPTAGQTYVATGLVEELPDRPFAERAAV